MADKELRQIPLTAMFIALGIAIPQVFHIFGSGSVFMPMFLPVYLGAMLLTWKNSVLLSVSTPVISFFITGMPPVVPPNLFIMIAELLIGALIISVLHYHLRKNLWIALIGAIIAGRIIYFLIVSTLLPLLGFEGKIISTALMLKAVPGIILQLLVIPTAVKLVIKKYPTILDRSEE